MYRANRVSSCGSALACLLAASMATTHAADVPGKLKSFPGAEGFGAYALGGRGGEVYEVTTLADAGPGSLRDGVSRGNRTIVFRISGTIVLQSRLEVKQPNITIAGQTAPGDGVCLRGHELFITNTENIIVRFLRLRPGDEAKQEMDALTIWTSKDVIIDHCSLSWSTDSLNDVVKESGNITVQWCLLAEPLVQSVHEKGAHGYATGWDGRTRGGGSFHHNLIAHAASRAPRIGYFKTGRGLIDCRNNVIYNSGPSYGGETDDFNYVGNYYRPGPDSPKLRPGMSVFDVWSADSRMFVAGNVIEGAGETGEVAFKQAKNANGETAKGDAATCLVKEAFAVEPVVTDGAEEAYRKVLASAGARLPKLDAADERVLNDVKNRTGRLVNTPAEVGGYPALKSSPAPVDSDHDGMPDAWEMARGLDPKNPKNAGEMAPNGEGCTWLEVYLNELAGQVSAR